MQFCPKDAWVILIPNAIDILNHLTYPAANSIALIQKHEAYSKILLNIPFVIPFDLRVLIFRSYTQRKEGYETRTTRVNVRRDHLFEDGFNALNNGDLLKGRVQIEFIDAFGNREAGIDGGGNFHISYFLFEVCLRNS